MPDTAARLALRARRNEICRFEFAVVGIDLTGADMKMQVRIGRDVPGPPLIQLGTVDTLAAEGLKLDDVRQVDGVPVSIIKGRINQATMSDPAKVPYMGEVGADTVLAYAMVWTIGNETRTRVFGDFVVEASAYNSDGAPSDRPGGYDTGARAAGTNSATLTFGDQVVRVTIGGADLLAPSVQSSAEAADRAQVAAAQAQEAAQLLDGVYQNIHYPGVGRVSAIGGTVVDVIPEDGPREFYSAQLSRRSIEGNSLGYIPGVAHVILSGDGVVKTMEMIDGRVIQLQGSPSGLPSGGKTGDVLLRDAASIERAAWQNLTGALAPTFTPILNMLPNTLRTATLQTAVGYTAANLTTYPQTAFGRGMSIDKVVVGACKSTGDQVALTYSRATGVLLEETVIQNGQPKDDHNPTSPACYDDGTFVVASSRGHNKSPSVGLCFRAIDGTWSSRLTLTYSGDTCYPGAFIDRNGKLWLFIRVGNRYWTIRTAASLADARAGNFTAERQFLTHTSQPYTHQRYDPVQHCFHIFTRPNGQHPSFGDLKRMRLDCATGELSDASGPLGKIDGTASANGKVLPVAFDNVATLFAHPAGKLYSVGDFSNDGRTLMVSVTPETPAGEDEDADESGATLGIWRLKPNGDPYVLADYDRYEDVLAGQGQIGTYRYGSGSHIAQEPHPGFRFYAAFAGSPSRIERWDCPSGDGVTWITTVLAIGGSGEILARPMSFNGANDSTPIAYAKFSTFDRYDTYTGEEVRFVRGDQ